MKAAGAQNPEDIEVGPLRRKIVPSYPGIEDADKGWQEAIEDLRLARCDPSAARARSKAKADGVPLELEPDNPWDQDTSVPLSEATSGQADSLTHDTRYFDDIDAATTHGGRLNALRDYHKRR